MRTVPFNEKFRFELLEVSSGEWNSMIQGTAKL